MKTDAVLHTTCPGCGAALPASPYAPLTYPGASAECADVYNQVAGHTLSLGDPSFPHQLVVDAYRAQHVVADSKPISVFFALVGLCMVVHYGQTGRKAQLAHMDLARDKSSTPWPTFELLPKGDWEITAKDVLAAMQTDDFLRTLHGWAESAWNGWPHAHDEVIAACQRFAPPW